MTAPNVVISRTNDAKHRRITVLIYGEHGIGKTSLIKKLKVSDDSKLLYVAADPGQLALKERSYVLMSPKDQPVSPMTTILKHAKETDYEWVVVDGIDSLAKEVLRAEKANTKDGRKAYGEMIDKMEYWLEEMRDLPGKNVMFITHMASTQNEMGVASHGPSMPSNALKDSVPAMFDLVGCMRSMRTENGIERLIQFQPEAALGYVCKDRSGDLDSIEKPDIAAILAKIHNEEKE
jgi:phage nucleotide-binding protein